MADTNYQSIKFYKGGSQPTEIGSVWFNEGVLSVIGTSGIEYFSGVRDAKFENKTLTITKADGTPLELDFSDVASAEILGKLREDLTGLQGTVSGIDTRLGTAEGKITAIENVLNGEGETEGLVDKVAANTAAIAKLNGTADEAGSVAAAVKAETTAREEAVKGVADRVAALETTVDAENGLVDRVEVLEGYFDGTSGDGVTGIVDAKINALDADVTSAEGTKVRVQVVETDGKVTAVTVTEDFSEITDDIEAAQGAAEAAQDAADAVKARVDTLYGVTADSQGDEGKSVRTIAAEEVAAIVDGADESYDTLKEIADWIAAHPEDAAEYNSRITALENKVDVDKVSTAISDAKTEVLGVIEENEKTTAAAYTELDGRVDTLEGKVTALEEIDAADRLTALEGSKDDYKAYADQAEADAIAAAATATDNKIAALDLPNTYEAKGTAAELLAAEKAEGGAIKANADAIAAEKARVDALETTVANVMSWTVFN